VAVHECTKRQALEVGEGYFEKRYVHTVNIPLQCPVVPDLYVADSFTLLFCHTTLDMLVYSALLESRIRGFEGVVGDKSVSCLGDIGGAISWVMFDIRQRGSGRVQTG
jgi:hypothetical protein